MYAIVDIAGQQFKLEKDQKIFVHRLEGEAGSKVDFDKVLLIENDNKITVGTPVIEGAMVYASILEHIKGDKVLVFKKKRKKGYRKLNGHRQYLTQILIEDIIEKGASKRVEAKKAEIITTKKPKKVVPPSENEIKVSVEPEVIKEVPKTPVARKSSDKPVAKKAAGTGSKAGSAVKKSTDDKAQKTEKTKTVKKTKEPAKEKKTPVARKASGKKAK